MLIYFYGGINGLGIVKFKKQIIHLLGVTHFRFYGPKGRFILIDKGSLMVKKVIIILCSYILVKKSWGGVKDMILVVQRLEPSAVYITAVQSCNLTMSVSFPCFLPRLLTRST
jgi:hypothetical protein